VLLVFAAPSQLLSLAGREHGRTVPLADLVSGRDLLRPKPDLCDERLSDERSANQRKSPTPVKFAVLIILRRMLRRRKPRSRTYDEKSLTKKVCQLSFVTYNNLWQLPKRDTSRGLPDGFPSPSSAALAA
jgi:hypothetical protein